MDDGGYLTLNFTFSTDGDLLLNPPAYEDVWIARLDAMGNILWQQCLGGSGIEEAIDLQLTSDGGCIFTGITGSNDGDVSGNHGQFDMWVVKLAPLPDEITAYVNPITDFAAYHNAASKTIDLSFYANGNEKVNAQLIDIAGRILVQDRFSAISGYNSHQVLAGDLSSGIYFVRMQTDGGAVTKKVVVQ